MQFHKHASWRRKWTTGRLREQKRKQLCFCQNILDFLSLKAFGKNNRYEHSSEMSYCLFCSLASSYLDTIFHSDQIKLFVYRGIKFTACSIFMLQWCIQVSLTIHTVHGILLYFCHSLSMSKWLVFHKGICCHKSHALLHSCVFSSCTVGTQHCRSDVNILSSRRNYVPSQGAVLPDRGMLSEPVFFLEPVTINHRRGLFSSLLSLHRAACLLRCLQVKSVI